MTFENFDGLLTLMQTFELPGWFSDLHQDRIVFFKVEYCTPCPSVSWAVVFTSSLRVDTYLYGQPFSVVVSELTTPFTTNSFSVIRALFDSIQHTMISSFSAEPESSVHKLKLIYELVTDILENLTNFVDIKITENLKFISEQLGLISRVKEGFSSKSIILCSSLYTINPQAYNFLQSYSPLILPHPEALKGICNPYLTNPVNQPFFRYIKSISPQIKQKDRDVVLFFDQILIPTILVTFTIKSVGGSFKEVVHIAPLVKINPDLLHQCIYTVIENLEGLGLRVFCVVSSHTPLNCKAMSKFSLKTEPSIVYPHPVCASRPLFHLFDSVELLKCFFEFWLGEISITYPDFQSGVEKHANFDVLHNLDCPKLKELFPSSLERQNVRLALRIFNSTILDEVRKLDSETADLISVILAWWKVVSAKSLNLQPKLEFLAKMLNWLDLWKSHPIITALSHSVYSLSEVTKYCLAELHLDCVALGKFQGNTEKTCQEYRHLATGHYHISLKQLYHPHVIKVNIHKKITLKSTQFGCFTLDRFYEPAQQAFLEESTFPPIKTTLSDYNLKFKPIATIVYLTAHCCRAALKKLSCSYCQFLLVYPNEFTVQDKYKLVNKPNHKGLNYPKEHTVNLILTMLIVFKKFLTQNEQQFFNHTDKRNCLSNLLLDSLVGVDLMVPEGCVVHHPKSVTKILVSAVSSTLVKGYCDAKIRTKTSSFVNVDLLESLLLN